MALASASDAAESLSAGAGWAAAESAQNKPRAHRIAQLEWVRAFAKLCGIARPRVGA